MAVSGASDESLSSEDAAAADGSIADGQSSSLTAGLSFIRSRSRLGISAGLTSSLRRYPGVDRLVNTSETATAGVTVRLNRTTGLRLGVDGSRILPFALDGLAIEPGPADGRASSTGLESTVLDGTRTTVGGLTEVTRTLGRWSTLTFGYGARQSETRFVGERIADQRAGGQFARRLGRDASFRIDYAARYSTRRVVDREQPAWSHDLQLGVERQWRHAAGRTSLYAGGGPSLVDEGPVLVNGDAGRAPATRVAGTVTFDHQIRSFGARASYRRGGTVRGVQLFSNTVAVDVSGRIGRRFEMTASGGYSDRPPDLAVIRAAAETRQTTSFGSARLQAALTRTVAAYGEYVFTAYGVDADRQPELDASSSIARRGLRAGLMFWLPLFEGR